MGKIYLGKYVLCMYTVDLVYRVRQTKRESYGLQDCERTRTSTEINDTSAESPCYQL